MYLAAKTIRWIDKNTKNRHAWSFNHDKLEISLIILSSLLVLFSPHPHPSLFTSAGQNSMTL
jgi:hypothetical protein